MREIIDEQAVVAEEMIRKVSESLGGTVDVERNEDEGYITIGLDQWIILTVYWGDYTTKEGMRPEFEEKVIYGITTISHDSNYPGGEDMEEELPHNEYDKLVPAVIEMFSLRHSNIIGQIVQGIEEQAASVEERKMYDDWKQ